MGEYSWHEKISPLNQEELNRLSRVEWINRRVGQHWFLYLHKKINEENCQLEELHQQHIAWVKEQLDQWHKDEAQRNIDAGFFKPEVVAPPSCFPEEEAMAEIVNDNAESVQEVIKSINFKNCERQEANDRENDKRIALLQKRLAIRGVNHVSADTLMYDRFDSYFFKRRMQYAECGFTRPNAVMLPKPKPLVEPKKFQRRSVVPSTVTSRAHSAKPTNTPNTARQTVSNSGANTARQTATNPGSTNSIVNYGSKQGMNSNAKSSPQTNTNSVLASNSSR